MSDTNICTYESSTETKICKIITLFISGWEIYSLNISVFPMLQWKHAS